MFYPQKRNLAVLFFVFMGTILSRGATVSSTGSGNWTTGGTWSTGAQPGCGDSIIIAAGHTVTTNANKDFTGCGTNMVLVIRGTLQFGNGDKYKFPCNTRLYVFGGGKIVSAGGGGNSNNIQICGNTEWQAGDGTYSGPGCLPPTLPGCGAVLPITLTQFSASFCQTKTVCLNWRTASEKNNHYYEVQRSADGLMFEVISTVNSRAPGGTTQSPLSYEAVDSPPPGRLPYYRLKQVDLDNSFSYSDLVFPEPDQVAFRDISIYPIPNDGRFYLSLLGYAANSQVHLTITNNLGTIVHAQSLIWEGTQDISLSTNQSLRPGIYLCTVVVEQQNYQVKLLIN